MYDVLIIGAGPAGISAAIWCDELGLETLVLEQSEQPGGQLLSIYGPVEDYPGVRASNGREFLERFSERVSEADFLSENRFIAQPPCPARPASCDRPPSPC